MYKIDIRMKKTLLAIMTALALVSCSTDELGSGATSGKGGVQLVVETDGFTQLNTRTANESQIEDLTVLEFKDSKLVKKVELGKDGNDFADGVSLSGDNSLVNLDASAKGNEDNLVYVIANAKATGNDTKLASITKFSDLKSLELDFSKDASSLLMSGGYYDGIENGVTSKITVHLARCVAKINFTVNYDGFQDNGEHPDDLKLESVQLCNVPATIVPYPCENRPSLPVDGKAGVWPDESQMTAFPADMSGSESYDEVAGDQLPTGNYVAYMPENARGSFDSKVASNRDKRPSKCDASITEADEETEKAYTYLLVKLSYTLTDGNHKTATYRIYLGGNSTGDMNLLRNTQYNVTTNIYGANKQDTRISVVETGATLDETYKDQNANCYMIDMSNAVNGKKLVIPLSQVNLGWNKIKEYDATQATTATNVADIITSGKWKIKTLWKTWDGATNVTGTKSSNFSASTPTATLNIPAAAVNGNNAVVELVSTETGTVYWSWHLWFTDYKPDAEHGTATHGAVHQYTAGAKYMMDRNLGAVITNTEAATLPPTQTGDAIKYYGLMYQFGRKDPFVGSGNGSNAYVATWDADGTPLSSNTSITPPYTIRSGSNSTSFLATAVKNPSTFYYSSSNWTKENTGLWDDNGKTVFDPCPPGWRVPKGGSDTDNPWKTFTTSNFTWSASASGTAGRMFTANNGGKAWYPTSGQLFSSTGVLSFAGEYGTFWSASSGYCMFLADNRMFPSLAQANSYGFAVRCVQDK